MMKPSEPPGKGANAPLPQWQRFVRNQVLLKRYDLKKRELEFLERYFSESSLSAYEFLAMAMLTRDVFEKEGREQDSTARGEQLSLTDLQAVTEYILEAIKRARQGAGA